MKILAIESSCDEFAAAVVENGRQVLAEAIYSQIDLHKAFGGVVPEIAARSHIEVAVPTVEACLADFQGTWDDIDAIAVTNRPGLIGSLLIGTLTARTLALIKNKPLYAVDHIEGHVYANWLNRETIDFPALALVASGGHTQIMLFNSHTDYQIVGETGDDAVGEVFDKVAKMLGLPYPGGPSIAAAAELGDPQKYQLPIPKCQNPLDFSFSGLKTAVLRAVQAECSVDHTFPSFELPSRLSDEKRQDFAASFQSTAVRSLVQTLQRAAKEFSAQTVLLAGGVAANKSLRAELQKAFPGRLIIPDFKYCTDNAAMIAARAYFLAESQPPDDPLALEIGVN
jgi:N6-L-threonylcarbamoyladenine synthase